MPEPLKLFISYRSIDAPKVDKIANDLGLLRDKNNQPKYAPWQDKRNLPPAHPNWWDAILDAIEACPVFVFHISQGSLESKMCLVELKHAYDLNRPIIPIVLEGEFVFDAAKGRYELSEMAKTLVPDWLGQIQFLFYTGADFYPQFDQGIERLQGQWPRPLSVERPDHPNANARMTNHARYDQACDYAERLAFAEAEKIFADLVRRRDPHYEAEAAEWLELLRVYADLIEMDRVTRTRFKFKLLWERYLALFPKPFGDKDWLFDPKGFTSKMAVLHVETPPSSDALPPVLHSETPAASSMTSHQYFERAQEHWRYYRYNQAIVDYTEAIQIDPQSANAYYWRALSYEGIGDLEHAIADYTDALRLNPHYADAYFQRGHKYYSKGEYEHAVVDYTEAIQLNPYNAEAYYWRGTSYGQKKEYERAIADYDAALRIDPNHVQAAESRKWTLKVESTSLMPEPVSEITAEQYFERAQTHWENGRYDQAITYYTEAIHLNPRFANAYNNRGISYAMKKEYDHSIIDFNNTLRLNPQNAEAYYNRGTSFHKKGEYDGAIADYTEALRLNPQFAAQLNSQLAEAYYNRGVSFHEQGEYNDAIVAFTEVLRLNPQNAEAYYNRGTSFHEQEEYDQAIADYDAALRLNPQNAEAYYNRGTSYYKKGEYDQAIADYDASLIADPQIAKAYTYRSLVYYNKNKYENLAGYDASLIIDPQYASPYLNRGNSYFNKEEYEHAIADYTEAIRINPSDVNAYYSRGLSHYEKGEYSRAIADYNAALDIKPNHQFAGFAREKALEAKQKTRRRWFGF